MSRADPAPWPADEPDEQAAARPARPGLLRSLRAAGSDFYYNSVRLVGLNLVWALCVAVVYLISLASPLAGIAGAVLLALPTAGIFRVAALIVRREPASLSDGLAAPRRFLVPALAGGAVLTGAMVVFLVDLGSGMATDDVVGIAFATMAGWGLIIAAIVACCWWPLLVDPRDPDRGGRASLRLACYVVIAHPLRAAGLAVVLGAILIVSTVLLAALFTVALSFCALVACHYVLPAADRMEVLLAARADARGGRR